MSVITTGVPKNPFNPQALGYPRLDVRTLATSPEYSMQFSLWVQSVAAMQKMTETEVKSWYQISGIHGLPHDPWDGVTNPAGRGFCEHNTTRFPTWHRPYVALYEQLLHDHAITIANTYTVDDKDLWQDAAYKLRAPYWDWASSPIPPLEVIAFKYLNIVLADGINQAFPNPFLGYTFHPGFLKGTALPDVAVITPTAKPRVMRPNTVRCSHTGSTETDLQALIDSLWGHGLVWKDMTHDTLLKAMTWNDLYGSGSGTVNSLEAIHGDVHVTVGGDGHMSSVPVAGFDPIFWMHHSNVDRLLALWQAIHYDQFMDAADAKKDLLPFRTGGTTYWDSTGARTLQPLNYTYPEFEGLDLGDKIAVKKAITKKVNDLYGPTEAELRQIAALSKKAEAQAQSTSQGAQQPLEAAKAAIGHAVSQVVGHPGVQVPAHTRTDWTVRIRSKLFQFDSSYSVLIFVGPPPASQHEWRTSTNYVGAFSAFVNSHPENCTNCMEHSDLVVEGFVPLTRSLVAALLNSLHPDTVVPYLKANIHWRIQKTDASIVDAKDMKDFEVAVVSVESEYVQDGLFKIIGKPSYRTDITAGKTGGMKLEGSG